MSSSEFDNNVQNPLQSGFTPILPFNLGINGDLNSITQQSSGSYRDPFDSELLAQKTETFNNKLQNLNKLSSDLQYNSPVILDDLTGEKLETAQDLTQDILINFANQSNVIDVFKTSFGDDYNLQEADSLLQQFAQGDFSEIPKIKVISSDTLNNANGAYSAQVNTIFLSDKFVNSHNSQDITGVFLEEIGHFIDAKINTEDSPGDEGYIFARLVQGQPLDSLELTLFKQEDDHGLMMINGQEIAIEMNTVSGTSNTLQTAQNVVLNSTPQTFTGFVGDSVVNNYLKFQVTTPSILSVELTGLTKDANVRLLDAQGNFIQASYNKGTATDSFPYQLNTGTYFIHVYREALGDNTNYTLNLASVPLTQTISTLQTAKDIGVLDANTQTFTGIVNDLVIHNYYKFKVTDPSTFSVNLSGLTKDANVRLLDAQGKFIQASYNKGTATDSFTYKLVAGDYFVHVYREAIGDNTSYSLKVSAPSLSSPLAPVDGAGNTKDTARNIGNLTATQTFKDLVGVNDKEDWYSFYVPEPGLLNISLNNTGGTSNIALFKENNDNIILSSGTGSMSYNGQDYIDLPGLYFLRVSQQIGQPDANYSLSLSTTSWVMDLGSLSGTRNVATTDKFSFYRFKLDQNSVVKVSSNVSNLIDIQVRDSSYTNTVAMWLDNGATLNAGTYYLAVSNNAYSGQPIPSSFTLNLQATATTRYDNAGLNYINALDLGTITSSKSVTDFIDPTDKLDYYSFTVDSKSSVNLNLTAITGSATVGVNLYNAQYGYVGSVNGNPNPLQPLTATLEAGKYYVLINDITGSTNVQYRFDINAQSLVANDAIGNTFAQAKDLGTISPNYPITAVKDAIGETDSADWFRFSTNKLGNILPVLNGLTTPVSLELMRIESNNTLTSLGKLSSNGVSNWQPAFNNLPVGNYALVLTSNSTISSPYTLNLSAVSTNTAPTNLKLNLGGTYSSNQDIIVTGSVYDTNGANDLDEVWVNINGQTYFIRNFTPSSTDTNVANFSLNIGKLPIGAYGWSAGAYDKSRDSSGITLTMGETPVQVVQQITTPPTGSIFQVATEILPYYSALSSAQQTKLGTPLSANATDTNGSWRQDFQNGCIIAWYGSPAMVYFNDGTSYELPKSLIQPIATVGNIYSTGIISSSLSSSDSRDHSRPSYFADDYLLTNATVGETIKVTLTSSGFVPQIFLVDATNGSVIAQSLSIINGNKTELEFQIFAGQNYVVRITSQDQDAIGDYTISTALVNSDNSNNPPPPPTSTTINGYTIDGSFYPVYMQYQGTLGNPLENDQNYSSTISYQKFENGSIVSSSYGTYPIYGGIRQTYLNTGGLNGWLGAPKSAEIGQGNGTTIQFFEGGYIYFNGQKATAYQTSDNPPNSQVLGVTDNSPSLIRTGGEDILNGKQISVLDPSFDPNKQNSLTVWTIIKPEAGNEGKKHLVTINWGAYEWNQEVTIGKDGIALKYFKNANDSETRFAAVQVSQDTNGAKLISNATSIVNVSGDNPNELKGITDIKDINSGWYNGPISAVKVWTGYRDEETDGQISDAQKAELKLPLDSNKPDSAELKNNPDIKNLATKLTSSTAVDTLWKKSAPLASGYLDPFYDKTYHTGFDMGFAKGTEVKALVGGTVIYVGGDFGSVAIHNEEMQKTFVYLHMDTEWKKDGKTQGWKVGDKIEAGDTIGLVSNVGADAIHLHFEVQDDAELASLAQTNPTSGKPTKYFDSNQLEFYAFPSSLNRSTKEYVATRTYNPLNAFLEAQAKGLTS